jgi:3-oxoacyl-[acyl-carrier-protein] synthase III
VVQYKNIKITSIVSCVPSKVEANTDLLGNKEEIDKIIFNSGINNRRISDEKVTAADLCFQSALHMFNSLDIDVKEIDILIFVTQYPDYILPSTVHIIKEKLGCKNSTLSFQINEGCAGYGYGLSIACALLQTSGYGHALLLVGDTPSKIIRSDDYSTRLLFGDAGTATLLTNGDHPINIELGSDGKSHQDIIVKSGSMRDLHGEAHLEMNGLNVFAFGVSIVPKEISLFLEKLDKQTSSYDYIVLHQANKMMIDRIVRKLNFSESQLLTSLEIFGNTSNASIPLTICHNLKNRVSTELHIIASGFGTGLAWSIFDFVLPSDVYLDLIEFPS